jgi:hypothetical protein
MARAVVLVLLALAVGSNALLGVIQSDVLIHETDGFNAFPRNGLFKEFLQPNHDYLLISNPETVVQGLSPRIVSTATGLFATDPLAVGTVVAAGPAAMYRAGDKVVVPTQCTNAALGNLAGNDAEDCSTACSSVYDARCATCRLSECLGGVINNGKLFFLVPEGLVLGRYSLGAQATNDALSGPTRFNSPSSHFPVA